MARVVHAVGLIHAHCYDASTKQQAKQQINATASKRATRKGIQMSVFNLEEKLFAVDGLDHSLTAPDPTMIMSTNQQ